MNSTQKCRCFEDSKKIGVKGNPMNHKRILLLRHLAFYASFVALIIFISGSHASEIHNDHSELQSIKSASTQCISKDFDSFIKYFSENVEKQKVCTRFPLERQNLDIDVDPEPKTVLKIVTKEQTKFPLMPNAEDRKAKGLTFRIDIQKNAQRAKVTLLKEDTDYQVIYFFSREKCWMLVRVEDWSL